MHWHQIVRYTGTGHPLPNTHAAPKPLPDEKIAKLKYSHLSTAIDSSIASSQLDPLGVYFWGENRKPGFRSRLLTRLTMLRQIRNGIAFTIGEGLAVCFSDYAPEDPKSGGDTLGNVIDRMLIRYGWVLEEEASAETKKRVAEFRLKVTKGVTDSLGPEIAHMMELVSIWTHPDYQGRGYGGRLLEAMNDIADSQRRNQWLISSNTANDYFYNSHGFYTVCDVYLGDDNPLWTKPPIKLQIMLRRRNKE